MKTIAVYETRLELNDIASLFGRKDGWCVSIYLPTHRAGKEIRQDPIRLKNRISEAEQQLADAGMSGGDIKRLIGKFEDLCDLDDESNREFWRRQGDGLALLISENVERIYKLPISVEELTIVANRFHLRPLVRTIQRDQEYCVLAVSQGNVQFLEGSRNGLSERPIEELPESLRAVVRGEHQKGFNLHSFKISSGNTETAVPHGHLDKDQHHELRRYFNEINEALNEEISADDRPLIFAGVAELFPYFEEATDYGFLVKEPITGNPDQLSHDQLHEKAWPLVAEFFARRQSQALDRWNEVAHTDIGETKLDDIMIAAHDGRIDTLLLSVDANQWGTFDPDQRKINHADDSDASNYDLYDLAAIKTLQASGRVITLDELNLPDDLKAAAICRFPLKS